MYNLTPWVTLIIWPLRPRAAAATTTTNTPPKKQPPCTLRGSARRAPTTTPWAQPHLRIGIDKTSQ